MKCAVCGKQLDRPAIREEADGRVYYYCTVNCLIENLHRRNGERSGGSPLASG